MNVIFTTTCFKVDSKSGKYEDGKLQLHFDSLETLQLFMRLMNNLAISSGIKNVVIQVIIKPVRGFVVTRGPQVDNRANR